MKKTRIFAFAGTAVLLLAGIFASKANKKYSGPTTVNYYTGSNFHVAWQLTGNDFIVTTNDASHNKAFFKFSGTNYTLYSAGPGYSTLYLPSSI